MKIKTILLAAFTLITTLAVGQSKITKTSFEVDGLCGMCKERIENAAYIQGVKQVNWDRETHELAVVFRNDKVTEADIITSINNAGHDVKGHLATDEQYANIHGCCRYRDPDLRAGHHLGTSLCEQEKSGKSATESSGHNH